MIKVKKISLIMPTLGRYEEVELFIKSLIKQTYKSYELIIVDQNDDFRIEKLYERYKKIVNMIYVKSKIKGLSKCRNIGLSYATGDIIAFPDDDCEYPDKLLDNIIKKFERNTDIDIITFKSVDKITREDSNTKWINESCKVILENIENTAISYTIFIKPKNIKDISFDERLGVGEYFGSAEETDLLSNLIYIGYNAIYFPELYAFHPIKNEVKERYYKYALGMGAFIKKELFLRSKIKYIIRAIELLFIRPIGGIIVNLLKININQVKRYYYIFTGRLTGFIKYNVFK